MGITRERHKRLRSIAETFVDKEVQPASSECRDRIMESLTTVLENVDHYARRDNAQRSNDLGSAPRGQQGG